MPQLHELVLPRFQYLVIFGHFRTDTELVKKCGLTSVTVNHVQFQANHFIQSTFFQNSLYKVEAIELIML